MPLSPSIGWDSPSTSIPSIESEPRWRPPLEPPASRLRAACAASGAPLPNLQVGHQGLEANKELLAGADNVGLRLDRFEAEAFLDGCKLQQQDPACQGDQYLVTGFPHSLILLKAAGTTTLSPVQPTAPPCQHVIQAPRQQHRP